MVRNWEHDWFNAEITFICSLKGDGITEPLKRYSLKDIAIEFEIPYQSVRRYAAAHDWQMKRSYYYCMIQEKTKLKTAELLYPGFFDRLKVELNQPLIEIEDIAYLHCGCLDPARSDEW